MGTTVYTLDVEGYAPEIVALTRPLLARWVDKIGATLHVIADRRFPDWPPVYEKLQIHDLARRRGDDWSIFIDADALVHPDFFDPTNHIPRDTVAHNGCDMAGMRWRYDEYFKRDGRNIGSCNWFAVASSWCRDLWRPLDDLTFAEAVERIYPVQVELNSIITRDHLIDDYTLSRNIARFGLKFKTVLQIIKETGFSDDTGFLWHQYMLTPAQKVEEMHKILDAWKV